MAQRPGAGESDPIDAEAVARVALREDDLPTAELPGPMREIKLLSDHRRTLVARRTATQSRVCRVLHEIAPDLRVPSRALRRQRLLGELLDHLEGRGGALVASLVICWKTSPASRSGSTPSNGAGQVRPDPRTRACCRFPGWVSLAPRRSSAIPLAPDASRVREVNCTAPIPVWSGNKIKVRLSRGGNRTINTAVHVAAVTQLRLDSGGAAYYDILTGAGKTRTEALRLLRRRISGRVFAALRADEQRAAHPLTTTAAPARRVPDAQHPQAA